MADKGEDLRLGCLKFYNVVTVQTERGGVFQLVNQLTVTRV